MRVININIDEFIKKCQYFFVKNIYGDHNDSISVRLAIKKILLAMPEDFIGLNVGAGQTEIHPNIKNMEIEPGKNIDYVGSVTDVPCLDDTFDVVFAQEVLEHVDSPQVAIKEIYRVLKKGGCVYLQLPFIIGYHPCPNDYWRFSHQGIRELLSSDQFEIIDFGVTVGPAVGFYRILVEFLAICLSLGIEALYKPVKLLASVVCWPLKLFDRLLTKSPQRDRIAGGYYVVGKKISVH